MKVQNNYDAPTKVKIATLAGSLIGTTSVVYGLTRGKQFNGSFLNKVQHLEMGIKDASLLCAGSVLGGLTGGLLTDKKENKLIKLREASNQIIGNAFVPFICLAIANNITKKWNKIVRAIISVSTLVGTTVLGHNVADKINEKLFGNKKKYVVGLKDFCTDIDDALFAASTVLNSKTLYKATASICPLTYSSLGYMAGTRQLKDKNIFDKLG